MKSLLVGNSKNDDGASHEEAADMSNGKIFQSMAIPDSLTTFIVHSHFIQKNSTLIYSELGVTS